MSVKILPPIFQNDKANDWAYLKFLIFGAPVSSRTQRTKVRPWSLTGRQGKQHSYIDPGNEDVQAQCAVYGLHTPESTW